MLEPFVQPQLKTATDVAFESIRAKILSGELAPGMKLTRRGMAELSGTSVIPVIEAMYRLENEGLVESKPLIGSRVVDLSEDRTRDIFALREAVECQVVRMLAGKLTAKQEADYRELAQLLDSNLYVESTTYSESDLRKMHYRFHAGLASLTGCPSLQAALHRVNLYDILRGVESRNRRRKSALPTRWHERLIDLLVAGDAEEAERAMRKHVISSLEVAISPEAQAQAEA